MGKKGGWISSFKKVLTFESKDAKEMKSEKSKDKYLTKNETEETLIMVPPATEKSEDEQNMDAYYVAIATAAAAEAAAAAARVAAAEVARVTAVALQFGKSKEEAAAVKIQRAFQAHLARKKLRALRGLARLKSMIQGQSVQRQSMITLKCMQTLTRVQSQMRSRVVKMSEENLALQQHLQQKNEKDVELLRVPASTINNENLDLHQYLQLKCEKEPEKMKTPASTTSGGEGWNASAGSKEQIEAKLQHKEEAAKKRERALAYAHSHQTVRKNPSKPGNPKPENPMITDQLTNTFWGWSWLERWNGTRPWEKRPIHDQFPFVNDENTSQQTDPTPKTKPPSPTPPPSSALSVSPKTRPVSLKVSAPRGTQPGHQRRHTIGGSLVKDVDKNLNQKTVSSKGKSRVASRLGNEKMDKGPFGSSKKQLSYSLSSPGERRHSGSGKMAAIF